MGLGTRDRTSNRTFSISVFHHRYRDRQKAIFFCGRRKDIFFRRKDPFFRRKDFFFAAGQDRYRSVFGSVFPTEPRAGWPVRLSYRTTVPKRYRDPSLESSHHLCVGSRKRTGLYVFQDPAYCVNLGNDIVMSRVIRQGTGTGKRRGGADLL